MSQNAEKLINFHQMNRKKCRFTPQCCHDYINFNEWIWHLFTAIASPVATPIFCCFACMAQAAEGCEFRVTWIPLIKIRQQIFKSLLLCIIIKKSRYFHTCQHEEILQFVLLHIKFWIWIMEHWYLGLFRYPCSRDFFGGVWIYKPVRYMKLGDQNMIDYGISVLVSHLRDIFHFVHNK